MYKILKAEKLADKIYLMDVHAPRVASHCQPGQFVIVKMDEKGERIPLTICDYDREAGTVTIVFQPIARNSSRTRASRALFRFSFSVHHSTRVRGGRNSGQPSCPCQKQPFTKIAVLYLRNTRSGVPGRRFTFTRKRKPQWNRYLRTIISGFVFLPLIIDMI